MLCMKQHMAVRRTCMAACETRQEQEHWGWHKLGPGSESAHTLYLWSRIGKQPTHTPTIWSAWSGNSTGEFLKPTKQTQTVFCLNLISELWIKQVLVIHDSYLGSFFLCHIHSSEKQYKVQCRSLTVWYNYNMTMTKKTKRAIKWPIVCAHMIL